MGRPWWQDSYWKQMDPEHSRRMRTICPHCGSDKTYYNAQFKVWRCGKCESSFRLKDYRQSWWQRTRSAVAPFFRRIGRVLRRIWRGS